MFLLFFFFVVVVVFCFLFFSFLFILFMIAWWPSAVKELSTWLSAGAVLLYVVFIVYIPFPFGVWGRMWNSISLPFDLL